MKKVNRLIFIAAIVSFSVQDSFGQSGILDPSFGSGGKTFTNFTGTDIPTSIAIQGNNKLIVAGYSTGLTGYNSFSLCRYNVNGNIDTGFGAAGKVITNIGVNDYANAVVLQSDGKIVVSGSSAKVDGNSTFGLARYNTNGSLDVSFGNGGKQTTSMGVFNSANAMVMQADGKIILAGVSEDSYRVQYFAIARYNSNGQLDNNFGTGGILTTAIQNNAHAYAVLVQDDGKIVAAGTSRNSNNNRSFALVRYNADGTLDANFGTDGKQTSAFGNNDEASGIVLQTDGKILVTGSSTNSSYVASFGLIRFNTNGRPDSSFGTAGKLITSFGGTDNANAITLQKDGKIVVAGTTQDAVYNTSFALARYNINGSLDAGFGNGGTAAYRLTPASGASASAVKWVGNHIYMAGTAIITGNKTFAIAAAFSDNIVLPITWLNINAILHNNTGLVSFTITNAPNSLSFDVERSIDGINFIKLGNILAANADGVHQYFYTDNELSTQNPITQNFYYRIKQLDRSGNYNYSPIAVITMNNNIDKAILYSNPVSSTAFITVTLQRAQKVENNLSDALGKIIWHQSQHLSAGINTISIDVNNLVSGTYYFNLKGEFLQQTIKFIKK